MDFSSTNRLSFKFDTDDGKSTVGRFFSPFFAFSIPTIYQGRQKSRKNKSLQLPGIWGEVNVRGNGNCKLRPACELSGTKCCDSGELFKVLGNCNA